MPSCNTMLTLIHRQSNTDVLPNKARRWEIAFSSWPLRAPTNAMPLPPGACEEKLSVPDNIGHGNDPGQEVPTRPKPCKA